ncbi:hypothetical protein DFH07DRAFT_768864 [Mycena maculata]|uniref:Uncharacterized protein n=1 Tax=Mycena maculata TaxID=230809 RepID=A0AAD7NQ15_9AGAR|nr:hypothetical protein DFH07DRAFT_768864 [Mycena maculata]
MSSSQAAEKVYAVIGGRGPGVFDRPPFMVNYRAAPVFPIVIKCTSATEAHAALGLQRVLVELRHDIAETDPEAFAKVLAGSPRIQHVFGASGPFYAVDDVTVQVHDNMYAKYHRFESVNEALVYMVLKGDIARMKQLGLYARVSTSMTPIVHRPLSTAKKASETKRTRPIFSYIRSLSGITDTIYGTSSAPEYGSHILGKHADYYLLSHGYTDDSIETIRHILSNSPKVDIFVDLLSAHGMAATETRWLWDLIHHDDNCGF